MCCATYTLKGENAKLSLERVTHLRFSKQYIYKFNLLFSFNRALPLSNKMSSLQLSKGALKQVFSKEGHDSVQIPMILQITNIKAFDVLPSDLKKFRILVNDGVYSTHGLIDESCSEYIKTIIVKDTQLFKSMLFPFCHTETLFVIKNFEVLAPTSEKSPNNIIPIDTYFLEHPEENYLTVMKNPRVVTENLQCQVSPTSCSVNKQFQI